MTEWTLLRPWALLLFIPTILLAWQWRYLLSRSNPWAKVIAPELLSQLMRSSSAQQRSHRWLLAGLIVAIVALAGPSWREVDVPLSRQQHARVLLLDLSLSMRATDLVPDRLNRARFKAIDLINHFDDGETALIVFAGEAFVLSPLSTDKANLLNLIPALSPELMPVAGSRPDSAINLAVDLLQQSGAGRGSLYLIGDEITVAQSENIISTLKHTDYTLSVLAVGTAAGAPIPLADGQLLKDNSGQIVIPTLDSANMANTAYATGGNFAQLSGSDADIERLVNSGLNKDQTATQQQHSQPEDGGYWLLLPLLFITLLSFRRGALALVPLFVLLNPPCPVQAGTDWWSQLWQNQEQRAFNAYQAKDYQHALNSSSAMLKGSAYYRLGQYQQAADSFAQLDTAAAHYNRGNALAFAGDTQAAIAAYRRALELQAEFPQAEENLQKLLEQQQQQQQQGEDQQQGDSSQAETGQDKPEQGGEPQSQPQDQQGSTGQQPDQQPTSPQDGEQAPSPNEQSALEQSDNNQQAQEETDSAQGIQHEQGSDEQTDDPRAQIDATTESAGTLPVDPKLQRWLEQIPDDPALLLRNKMRLEYEKRRRTGTNRQGGQQW